jgi:glycosyltransferase involved in cell wall biosynthesis
MVEQGISVVIPLFNKSHVIADVLLSVINQSSPPDELIIVDDASRDDSFVVAQSIQKKYNDFFSIKLLRNASNRGPSFSRNVGIANATHEYIYFLDADDLMFKHTIANLRRAVSVAKPDIVFTKAIFSNSSKTHPSRVIFQFTEKIDRELFQIVDPFGLLAVEFPMVGSNFAVRNFTNLRFHNDEFQFEDCLFIFEHALQTKRIVYLNQFSIVYNQDSLHNLSQKPLSDTQQTLLPRLYQRARNSGYPDIASHILFIWMSYLATRSPNRRVVLKALRRYQGTIIRKLRINKRYASPFLRIFLPSWAFNFIRFRFRPEQPW